MADGICTIQSRPTPDTMLSPRSMRTTLRRGLGADLLAEADVANDLETLAAVLRVAADRGVPFSLVLRLQKKDSIQVISSGEHRKGSFW